MALVKLKQKGQITLPAEIRVALSLKEGDLLEASIENGNVSLRPKSIVDRDRQEAMNQFFARREEQTMYVEAQLGAEGKTWNDLDAEVLDEVKAHREEQAQGKVLK